MSRIIKIGETSLKLNLSCVEYGHMCSEAGLSLDEALTKAKCILKE